MDDVISIFSSPAATHDHPPRVDLGVVEITDSEPEELDNDNLFWTGLRRRNATSNPFLHRNGKNVKEDSPMDVDVDIPATVAGPSTSLPAPEPFPEIPVIHIQPVLGPQMTQEPDMDPHSKHLALVLEIVPDVIPTHAMELIEKLYPTYKDQVAERVLQRLFDDPSYPKVEKGVVGKGKRKASEMEDVSERPPSKVKIDLASVERPKPTGKNYKTLALHQLYADFPYIPVSHIRRVLTSKDGLYAPTHIQLTAELESDLPPFTLKATKTTMSMGKGKGKWKWKEKEIQDDDFDKERTWLLLKDVLVIQEVPVIDGFPQDRTPGGSGTLAELDVILEDGSGLECGCCFSPAPFHSMIQCPDAHLFCTNCMVAYASNLLGEHKFKIVCIDQSGCKLLFPESELRRFLTPQLLSLYERVKQAKEIEMAGLDGLEECPHCEFKVVIDNPGEKLFRCQNEECGAVTCRECKKPDHLPKSCAEVDEDGKIDARHVVEEAMTNALVRNCPKCNKIFIKESGCNKMTCPNCMTLSCYVCRKVITGYGHFDEARAGQPQRPENAGKCPLWDKVEERHHKEVEEAQKKAIAKYRKEHPEMGEDVLQVELPKATGEASGSRWQRRGGRRVPPRERIEPLRPAEEPDHHFRLHGAALPYRMWNPAAGLELAFPYPNLPQMDNPAPGIAAVQLPQPQQNRPYLVHPARAGQHPREVQEPPKQPGEDARRHPEDNWARRRRLVQQRQVLAGRFAEIRAGGARMDPVDRGRVDEWRRGVPGPEDGAVL